MRSWLMRWLSGRREPTDAGSSGSDAEHAPPWAAALEERLRKVARVQSKVSLRLDELLRAVDERLPAGSGPRAEGVDPTPILDALDRLDEARRVVSDRPAVERGLEGIAARLEGFLGAMGVERRADVGVPADPRLFRVIGVEPGSEAQEGMVVRVVRAAALRGSRVIREGEVLVGRGSS